MALLWRWQTGTCERLASLLEMPPLLGETMSATVPELNVDPVRRAIDEALSAALGLPDLAPLREMLAQEPGLTGKSAVSRRTGAKQR